MKTYFVRVVTKSGLRNLFEFTSNDAFMEAVDFVDTVRLAVNVAAVELLSIGKRVINVWGVVPVVAADSAVNRELTHDRFDQVADRFEQRQSFQPYLAPI